MIDFDSIQAIEVEWTTMIWGHLPSCIYIFYTVLQYNTYYIGIHTENTLYKLPLLLILQYTIITSDFCLFFYKQGFVEWTLTTRTIENNVSIRWVGDIAATKRPDWNFRQTVEFYLMFVRILSCLDVVSETQGRPGWPWEAEWYLYLCLPSVRLSPSHTEECN